MDVMGCGFIARHALAYIGDRHPDATLIAAGVSNVRVADATAFGREADLVYEVPRYCRERGRTAIFLSTASAGMYGALDCPGREDGPVFPLTPYGRHKLALERVCVTSGARFLVLRLTHIVGSGQKAHQLLPALARQLLSGRIQIYDGASRDLLAVRDMLTMIDLLLLRGVHDEVVNIATGHSEAVERIVDELELRLGTHAERDRVDLPTKHAAVDTSKLRSVLPEFERFRFDAGYLPALLDQQADELAAAVRRNLSPLWKR